ncbi:MAG: hypothetical protein ACKVKT_10500 [Rhodospirillales bacterium]|jgi:hypothetical protein
MINRSVLILRYKQLFVDWVNAADPVPANTVKLADVHEDSKAYLVEVEDEDELAAWIKANGELLFEEELNGWYTDPTLWPIDRSLAQFKRWCSFELHTVVVDTGATPLVDDDEEEGEDDENVFGEN